MSRMEEYLEKETESIDFTAVRPPGLENKPASGKEVRAFEGQFLKEHTMGMAMGN